MKTTLELPDELMRAVKIRAVNEDRSLKDMMAEIVRRGLAQEPPGGGAEPRRVRVPLVECAHEARPDEEMTPERVAEVLAVEDASGVRDRP
jgi:plasmid stability protein